MKLLAFVAIGLMLLDQAAFAAEPAAQSEPSAKGLELFKSQVSGMLKQHCVKCHGGKKTEADFDMTTRQGLLHPGDNGPAIVPGRSGESRLMKLVRHEDEPNMPFESDKLPDAAIAALAAWIDAGAPYDQPLIDKRKVARPHPTVSDEDRKFWSFRPLAAVGPPVVGDAAWCRTPVDRFVLAKLADGKLAPNAPADRRTLIRRASFDLTGLPPTPEEFDAFLADDSPDAYERLIDRLLASPHYGERWGRHWLDLARFAESHGYEQDYDRPNAYHYRDFVIRGLNDDLPYDKFVQWQIAGDEIDSDNPLAVLATGFLAAGTHATQITANQAEKERYDELDDMTRTIGTTMLGLTIGCARCHDHKYDPIPNRDYYRLVATFATTVRSDYDVVVNPQEYRRQKEEFDRQHAPLVEALARFEREQLPERLRKWLADRSAAPREPQWIALEAASIKSAGGATFTRQDDGSYLASGASADFDAYTMTARVRERGITAVRVEALAHASLVKGGPGRADNGNFDLTDVRVTAAPASDPAKAVPLKLVNPKGTFEQGPQLAVALAIDADKKSGWAVDPQFGKDHAAVFEIESDVGFDGGTELTFTLEFSGNHRHSIGRLRLAVTTAPRPVGLDGLTMPADVAAALAMLDSERRDAKLSDVQQTALLHWYRQRDAEWQRLHRAAADHLAAHPKPRTVTALISSEGVPAVRMHTQGLDFYDPVHLLKRGDPNQKIEPATQGFLQVLTNSPQAERHWQEPPPQGWRTSYRRRALANWITDREAGAGNLLARVIVNRLWQHHLGRGIVSTPSDFGAQGELPTHPELLDYLAGELLRGGWKLKPLHKLIMTSSVYMQSAAIDPTRRAADPDNRLVWHWPRRRLEAEAIRDAMLASSGLLDRTMYGPGTLEPNHRRRSIYFFVKRSKLVPMLVAFDAPDALLDIADRPTTTVAPQALALLNGQLARDSAAALAARLGTPAASSPDAAVREVYRRTLGRPPSDAELADSLKFLAEQSAAYQSAGHANAGGQAIADFCQALLSLNEFVYVE